eukprot:4965086-Amphidinium_carterae.1
MGIWQKGVSHRPELGSLCPVPKQKRKDVISRTAGAPKDIRTDSQKNKKSTQRNRTQSREFPNPTLAKFLGLTPGVPA